MLKLLRSLGLLFGDRQLCILLFCSKCFLFTLLLVGEYLLRLELLRLGSQLC